jgi:hypothetical protein
VIEERGLGANLFSFESLHSSLFTVRKTNAKLHFSERRYSEKPSFSFPPTTSKQTAFNLFVLKMKSFYFVIGQFFLYLLFSQALELNTTASWSKSDAPSTSWVNVVSDSSGRNLAAMSTSAGSAMTGLYLSTDFGETWKNTFISGCGVGLPWTGVAMDSSGYSIYALQQNLGVYYSHDAGRSWTRTIVDSQLTYAYYNSITTNGGGDTVFVTISNGYIYYSRNSGMSFSKSTAPIDQWWSIATMSTGQFSVALAANLYYSTNYGYSWSKANAPAQDWYSAHASSNGQFVVAVAGGGPYSNYGSGGVYTSSDYGLNFVRSSSADPSLYWRAVTSDASGKVITAAVSGGDVYHSSDYGKTFEKSAEAPSGDSWRSVTCDANGAYYTLASGNSAGMIYYSVTGV